MLKNGEDPGLFNKMYTRYKYAHDATMYCQMTLLSDSWTFSSITRNVIQRTSCTMYMYMDYDLKLFSELKKLKLNR